MSMPPVDTQMQCNAACDPAQAPVRSHNLHERLDNAILQARMNVERLCVLKARVEALNMLDYPTELFDQLSEIGYF